jgi:hypothetical protein
MEHPRGDPAIHLVPASSAIGMHATLAARA